MEPQGAGGGDANPVGRRASLGARLFSFNQNFKAAPIAEEPRKDTLSVLPEKPSQAASLQAASLQPPSLQPADSAGAVGRRKSMFASFGFGAGSGSMASTGSTTVPGAGGAGDADKPAEGPPPGSLMRRMSETPLFKWITTDKPGEHTFTAAGYNPQTAQESGGDSPDAPKPGAITGAAMAYMTKSF